ncbi:helix-turn-helix domain-containing protein [Serratia fonticola]|uniref:helix-turn-helix domain-containing protein n=1 Tax=Serratia fonticola TaxID=47917 RepID=UPI003AAAB372
MFLITDAQGIEALKYLAIGMSGHDTAGLLGIKGKTVNGHKRNAMRKLCVKTNQELYRWMELGGSSHLVGPTLI